MSLRILFEYENKEESELTMPQFWEKLFRVYNKMDLIANNENNLENIFTIQKRKEFTNQ